MHLRRTQSRMTRRVLWRSVAKASPTRSTRAALFSRSLARLLHFVAPLRALPYPRRSAHCTSTIHNTVLHNVKLQLRNYKII